MARYLIPAFAVILLACPSFGASAPNGGWDAVWSPDGARIAFISGSPHSIPDLWVMGADGVGVRRLTIRGAHEPGWLPDGKTIVFGSLRSGGPSFYSIDADGEPGSEKPVTVLPPGSQDPLWSPDGSLVAYATVSKDGGARDLGCARSNGGGTIGLTTKFWVREWTWSPDGSALAFTVGRSTGTSVWTVCVKDREIKLLYKGFCSAPAYSPDGKRLALAVPDARSGSKIRMIGLETMRDKYIGVRTFDGRKFIWSRDGGRLFFSAGRKSDPAIWSVGSDGKGLECITRPDLRAGSPSLSPDGSRIVFSGRPTGSFSPEVYTCDASGSSVTRLTESSSSYWMPVWSPDGTRLAFQSDRQGGAQLFVGSASGSGAKAVIDVPGDDLVRAVSWFPDGRKLLVGYGGRILVADAGRRLGEQEAAKPFSALKKPVQDPQVNGDLVFFTEWRGRDAGIASVRLDGTGHRVLTNKPEEQAAPQPENPSKDDGQPVRRASDGVLVASSEPFVTQDNAPTAEDESSDPHKGLGLMGPQPGLEFPEQSPAVVDLSPAVSPDGKLLAFIRDDQLWVVTSEGGNERQVTQFWEGDGIVRVLSYPSWSTGGDEIVFQALGSKGGRLSFEIWLTGPDKGSERMIYSEAVDSEYGLYYTECTNPPAFTPDGRVLFTSLSRGEPRIVSVKSDGSDLRDLAPAPSSFPAMDRAGKRLAFVDLSGSLERIRILDLTSGKVSKPLFVR